MAAFVGIRTQRDDALALRPVQAVPQSNRSVQQDFVDQRITAVLADASQPKPFSDLRVLCRVRATTLYERLGAMIAAGTIVKSADGYRLAAR